MERKTALSAAELAALLSQTPAEAEQRQRTTAKIKKAQRIYERAPKASAVKIAAAI